MLPRDPRDPCHLRSIVSMDPYDLDAWIEPDLRAAPVATDMNVRRLIRVERPEAKLETGLPMQRGHASGSVGATLRAAESGRPWRRPRLSVCTQHLSWLSTDPLLRANATHRLDLAPRSATAATHSRWVGSSRCFKQAAALSEPSDMSLDGRRKSRPLWRSGRAGWTKRRPVVSGGLRLRLAVLLETGRFLSHAATLKKIVRVRKKSGG